MEKFGISHTEDSGQITKIETLKQETNGMKPTKNKSQGKIREKCSIYKGQEGRSLFETKEEINAGK